MVNFGSSCENPSGGARSQLVTKCKSFWRSCSLKERTTSQNALIAGLTDVYPPRTSYAVVTHLCLFFFLYLKLQIEAHSR